MLPRVPSSPSVGNRMDEDGGDLSEIEKLKNVVKQMLRDKAQLKEELEKEQAAHEADIKKWTQEQIDLKAKFQRMAEEIANKPKVASPEQVLQIEALELQISRLESDIRGIRLKHEEAKINREVLMKQVKQYSDSVTKVENELAEADAEQTQLALHNTKISALEDELRMKTEKVKEIQTNIQWADSEIDKLSQQLSTTSKRSPVLASHNFEIVSLPPQSISIRSEVEKCWKEIHGTEFDSDSPDTFIATFADRFTQIELENEKLMQKVSQLKRKYAKCIGIRQSQKHKLSPDQLKEAALKLAESNRRKADKIAKLKDIVTRQYVALQKVVGSPTSEAALSVALRNTIQQLSTCPHEETKLLVAQGERILDAIQGILD